MIAALMDENAALRYQIEQCNELHNRLWKMDLILSVTGFKLAQTTDGRWSFTHGDTVYYLEAGTDDAEEFLTGTEGIIL